MLEGKIDTGTEYVIGWKSKGAYKFKLSALNVAFLLNIKYFQKEIEIQFNNTALVIEQNFYTAKIVNIYIVYDLDN